MSRDRVELAPASPGHPPLVARPADFARLPGTLVLQAGRQCWVIEPDRLAELDQLRVDTLASGIHDREPGQ